MDALGTFAPKNLPKFASQLFIYILYILACEIANFLSCFSKICKLFWWAVLVGVKTGGKNIDVFWARSGIWVKMTRCFLGEE